MVIPDGNGGLFEIDPEEDITNTASYRRSAQCGMNELCRLQHKTQTIKVTAVKAPPLPEKKEPESWLTKIIRRFLTPL